MSQERAAAARGGRTARPRAAGRSRSGARTEEPAAQRPVARVVVDVPLPHLDRPFDYLVPARFDADAVPGCRVRVRFSGQLVDGYLRERVDESGHTGRLARLERVVSPEPVVTDEMWRLARAVADRYAGTLADVLRLAVPPRHAKVEREQVSPSTGRPAVPGVEDAPDAVARPGASAWEPYPAGPALLRALAEGRGPHAVWTALPGPTWPGALAAAVQATVSAGRGAVVVAPDGRDVDRIDDAVRRVLGDGAHVVLTAGSGPAERYRRWLAVRRGAVRAVVGTRAAMFAPVADLGLVALWDDGDDVLSDPHAPYPHAREVLTLRAHLSGAGFLLGALSRTAEGAQLVTSGWAQPVTAPREVVRAHAPRVRVAGDDADLAGDEAARTARLPSVAWRTARDALARGPVLVQVPRRGYVPSLACGRCRAPARCTTCAGPLSSPRSGAAPVCRWCGRAEASWRCPACGHDALRAAVVGARRTAEELGRAFPGTPVRTSGRDGVLARVDAAAALVVSTPGAEPVADEGYAAALLLDGWALLGRPDLRAGEEALRRWSAAAALVRPAREGGAVVLLAEPDPPAVQALVRWDPVTFSERELAERVELGFPPAAHMASLTGVPSGLADLLASAVLPDGAQVLGPVPVPASGGEPLERALVRVPRGAGRALAAALHDARAQRSVRKAGHPVRVQIDPVEIA